MMKAVITTVGFAILAAAAPANVVERQLPGNGGKFDLEKGNCQSITLIWARGTNEAVNIGSTVGVPLLDVLGGKGLTDLAVQGVTYAAGVKTNFGTPGGADPEGVKDAIRLFNLAHSKCPDTIIVGGGFAQGAAIMHLAAKGLPTEIEKQIAGIALFGDTQNAQSNGHIAGFPQEKSKVFCEPGDGVCYGSLNINHAHSAYNATDSNGKFNNGKLLEGAGWIVEVVEAAKEHKDGTTQKPQPQQEKESEQEHAAAPPGPATVYITLNPVTVTQVIVKTITRPAVTVTAKPSAVAPNAANPSSLFSQSTASKASSLSKSNSGSGSGLGPSAVPKVPSTPKPSRKPTSPPQPQEIYTGEVYGPGPQVSSPPKSWPKPASQPQEIYAGEVIVITVTGA